MTVARSGWPSSALGIDETADKDVIRAAYVERRAGLGDGGSISAFADLTAAREKALFLAGLAQDLRTGAESFEEARSSLRMTILAARRVASREQALGIAELHLAWLLTARRAGNGDCREVTGKSFFDGVPHMRGDWTTFRTKPCGQPAAVRAFHKHARPPRYSSHPCLGLCPRGIAQ